MCELQSSTMCECISVKPQTEVNRAQYMNSYMDANRAQYVHNTRIHTWMCQIANFVPSGNFIYFAYMVMHDAFMAYIAYVMHT